MKKIWSTDGKDIVKELAVLRDDKSIITLCLKGQKNRAVVLRAIEEKRNHHLLVFEKQDEGEISKETCLFFYTPTEYLTRGFQGQPLKDIGKLFSLVAPHEIFEIGKRTFPRVSTPNDSRANFTLKGKTKIFNSQVIDISLEGAMLKGVVPPDLAKGDVTGPITMTLNMEFGSDETRVQVAESTVVNIIDIKDSKEKKVCLHFSSKDANQSDLEPYIDLRVIEENVCG